MTMQADLRAELGLIRGEPVPAEVALALRDDAAMAMAMQEHADSRFRATELMMRARWWRGLVRDFVEGRATTEDLARALADADMRETI